MFSFSIVMSRAAVLTLRDLVEPHIGHKGASNGNSVLEQGGILARAEELLVTNSGPGQR